MRRRPHCVSGAPRSCPHAQCGSLGAETLCRNRWDQWNELPLTREEAGRPHSPVEARKRRGWNASPVSPPQVTFPPPGTRVCHTCQPRGTCHACHILEKASELMLCPRSLAGRRTGSRDSPSAHLQAPCRAGGPYDLQSASHAPVSHPTATRRAHWLVAARVVSHGRLWHVQEVDVVVRPGELAM